MGLINELKSVLNKSQSQENSDRDPDYRPNFETTNYKSPIITYQTIPASKLWRYS